MFETAETDPEPEAIKLNSYQKIMRQYVCKLCPNFNVDLCQQTNIENPWENRHCLDKQELKFRDKTGRIMFVSAGLGKAEYGTFYRKSPNHTGMHRVKSPAMPMMPSRDEAERNFIFYARDKGFVFVVEEEGNDQADAV